jgi:hypothetical protein
MFSRGKSAKIHVKHDTPPQINPLRLPKKHVYVQHPDSINNINTNPHSENKNIIAKFLETYKPKEIKINNSSVKSVKKKGGRRYRKTAKRSRSRSRSRR